ncbi:MAG: DUF697 domain-containing protein [Phycisphaerae bacterium]
MVSELMSRRGDRDNKVLYNAAESTFAAIEETPMFRQAWKSFKTIVLIAGVILTFFAVIEVIQAYHALDRMHPYAGTAFLIVLGIGLTAGLVYYIVKIARRPKVLHPPKTVKPDTAEEEELRKYCRYLRRFMLRLARNHRLDDETRAAVATGALDLHGCVKIAETPEEIRAALDRAEQIVKPALTPLDEEAERLIRASVRSIMFWVAMSPYKSLDLIVVGYRNLAMIASLVGLYNSRPRVREQLAIVRDTLRVVATVNFLNFGKNVFDELFSNLPGGRFADDIAQGIGAGFMSSAAGHAAMQRCRAYRGWDEQTARECLRLQLRNFYHDVRDMFMKDVWSAMRDRMGAIVPGGTWDTVTGRVREGLREAGETIETNFSRPATSGADSVRRAANSGRQAMRDFFGLFRNKRREQ